MSNKTKEEKLISIGLVEEVSSFYELKVRLFASIENLGVGSLLKVISHDGDVNRMYLVRLIDITDVAPFPGLRLEELLRGEVTLRDLRELMERLPGLSTHLRTSLSTVIAICRVLGEIKKEDNQISLVAPSRPPRAWSAVMLPEAKELEMIVHAEMGQDYAQKGAYLGTLSYLSNVRVYLNPSKFNMHMAILAQTGAGKTETAKRIIYEFIKSQNDACSLIFDVVGQYSGLGLVESGTVSLFEALLRDLVSNGRKLKFTWIFPLIKIAYRKLGGLRKVSQVFWKKIIRPLNDYIAKYNVEIQCGLIDVYHKLYAEFSLPIPDAKDDSQYIGLQEFSDTSEVKNKILDWDILLTNYWLPNSIRETFLPTLQRGRTEFFEMLIRDTVELQRNARKEGRPYKVLTLIDVPLVLDALQHFSTELIERYGYWQTTINSVKRDLRYVKDYLLARNFDPEIHYYLLSRISSKNTVTFIHLTTPVVESINTLYVIAYLLDELFELYSNISLLENIEVTRNLLIVLEEAHRYAPASDDEAKKNPVLPVLEKIAREGRKFGLGLCIISQRPAFINKTILSQCSTLVALRIRNKYDQEQIRYSVESILEEDVKLLPELNTGEALVSGAASPSSLIPLRVKVEMLK